MDRPTGIDWEVPGSHGQVKFGNDRLTLAVFYTRSVLNPAKSKEANRPIHDNHTYVRIQPAGERLNIVDRPVQDNDKRRWPEQWRQYLAGKTQVPEGTPIELLFPNHPAIADTLKGCNVYTVEQLANLSGNAIDSVGMGAQDWVNKANAYLSSAEKGKDYQKLAQNLEAAQSEIRVLKNQLAVAVGQIRSFEQKLADPNRHSLLPTNIQGIDPQTERINANRAASVDFEAVNQQQNAINAAKLEEKLKDPYAINTGEEF